MFLENTYYIKEDIEEMITERFKNIIAGKGPMISRIAVKVAIDSLFSETIVEACCCGIEISRDHRAYKKQEPELLRQNENEE